MAGKEALTNSGNELIVADGLAVSVTTEAETLKAEALEASALIFRVNDAGSQEAAVNAQRKLLAVIRAVEKARKAVKEPILQAGRTLDQKAAEFTLLLDQEGNRIAALVNDFQEKERVRLIHESKLQDANLTKLQREESEMIACAETVEEQDRIREEYGMKTLQASVPVAAPVRVPGQMVRTDWEITVVNPYELAKFHPNCVVIQPLRREIKELLDAGVTVRGIKAEKKTGSTVRTPAPKPPLDV